MFSFLFFVLVTPFITTNVSFAMSTVYGSEPPVNGQTPNITISRNISVYPLISDSPVINLHLSMYDIPTSNDSSTRTTIFALRGTTTVNSSRQCIGMGISFDFGNDLFPNGENGHGGCDGLWGNTCSTNIQSFIFDSLNSNINFSVCGSNFPFSRGSPSNCPSSLASASFAATLFFRDGQYLLTSGPPTYLTPSWIYYQSEPLPHGQNLFNHTIFVYFIGRLVDLGINNAEMACFYSKSIVASTTITTSTIVTTTSSNTSFHNRISSFTIFLIIITLLRYSNWTTFQIKSVFMVFFCQWNIHTVHAISLSLNLSKTNGYEKISCVEKNLTIILNSHH